MSADRAEAAIQDAVYLLRKFQSNVEAWGTNGREVRLNVLRLCPHEHVIVPATHGDPEADYELRRRAADIIDSGQPLPSGLAEYVAKRLRNYDTVIKRRRGRNLHVNKPRNFMIALVVLRVAERGFSVNRNVATDHESASSIVAQALERVGIRMGEHAVAKVFAEIAEKFTTDDMALIMDGPNGSR